jgi:hypothetical protein
MFKSSKLEHAQGCVGCRKPCNFNGLRVDVDSPNAARRDKDKMLIRPNPQDMYGCNSAR